MGQILKYSYWNNRGLYQETATALEKRIPTFGKVEDAKQHPKLERLRRATNMYYDLYNNGAGNTHTGMHRGFKGLLGVSIVLARDFYRRDLLTIEASVDRLVKDAAAEQNVPLVVNAECQAHKEDN